MNSDLSKLGFSTFFSQQLTPLEYESLRSARVIEVQRSGLRVTDGAKDWEVTLGGAWFQRSAEGRPTVGDWLLLDESGNTVVRLLHRKSLFQRVAAGTKVELQPIAANVDTLFIVSSCNEDFNESRLERYLALALEAGTFPVIILTKSDLANDSEHYVIRARTLRSDLAVELVNALDVDSVAGAAGWVSPGQTVALVGSSGVGKSTLVNTLAGKAMAVTSTIREQDAKGRHTTTSRTLYQLPNGGLLLDVPGMRELKVAEVTNALDDLFDDIAALAKQCRFTDCSHEDEPGCAVGAALERSELQPRRLQNYRKLQREEARHNATIHEKHQSDRAFGREIKNALAAKRKRNS